MPHHDSDYLPSAFVRAHTMVLYGKRVIVRHARHGWLEVYLRALSHIPPPRAPDGWWLRLRLWPSRGSSPNAHQAPNDGRQAVPR
jgi:hypothetical protein